MFGKTPDQLNADDIANIVLDKFAEGQSLEFKATLPDDGKTVDPWCDGKDKIGELAKAKLGDEIVAFANAYGGWLLIGFEETEDEPKRAKSISPVRDCAGLASRLRLIFRDLIDPEIPNLQIAGIPTCEDGSGVIAIHVAISQLAPHRNTKTLNCTKRRADSCEKMTMREIQDLTIRSIQRDDAINVQFEDADRWADARFEEFLKSPHPDGEPPQQSDPSFMMVTRAVPIEGLGLGRIHGNQLGLPKLSKINGESRHGRAGVEGFILRPPDTWRPVLRGTHGQARSRGDFECGVVLHETGQIEFSHFATKTNVDRFRLYYVWVLGQIWHTLINIELMRVVANMPETEFELRFLLHVRNEPLPIINQRMQGFDDEIGAL